MQLSPKQLEYVRSANNRWNLKVGAVRSGKSFVDIAYTIPARLRAVHGKDGLNVILGVSRETIERNVLKPMREIYTDRLVGMINSRNIVKVCGEDVYCLGAEKVSQVAKIVGSSIKYAYGDEIAKWNQEVFAILQSRLDKPYSKFDGACNPEFPTHWLKGFIDRDDIDIYLQKYTIYDNPFLSPDFVSNLCKEYAGTVYFKRFILGEWALAEGLIYRDFADTPSKFTVKNPKEWMRDTGREIAYLSIGVDFGGTNSATKFQATVITKDFCVVAVDEEYIDHQKESVDPNDLNRKYSRFVRRVNNDWGAGQTRADSAEQILIRGLFNTARSEGLGTQVKNAMKMPIMDRIRLTIALMGQGRFFVAEGCPHLIDALSNAVYDADKTEDTRLDDGTTDIDSLDAFEYSIEPYYKQLEAAGHGGLYERN